ncbi:hypothetical protein KY289_012048 [Solanum tuberosum]|nr:hypothetical protein KY289_012048 [Solanum tuberosum]
MLLLESHDTRSSTTRPECLAFLDEQHVNSVMFVSFGTNTKFSQEQVNELMLGHKSKGGFLSHCGWNSCLESTSMVVHIAAWPNNADQPYNAVFVTTKIGICVELGSERRIGDSICCCKSCQDIDRFDRRGRNEVESRGFEQ